MFSRKNGGPVYSGKQQLKLVRMGPSGVDESPQQHTLPGGQEANEKSHGLTKDTLGSTNLLCVPANGKRKKGLTVFLLVLTKRKTTVRPEEY